VNGEPGVECFLLPIRYTKLGAVQEPIMPRMPPRNIRRLMLHQFART
jgi:hypothetical protein